MLKYSTKTKKNYSITKIISQRPDFSTKSQKKIPVFGYKTLPFEKKIARFPKLL